MGLNEMIRRGAGSALAEIEKLDEFIERNPRASLRKFKKWAMEERLSLPLFEKPFVGSKQKVKWVCDKGPDHVWESELGSKISSYNHAHKCIPLDVILV